MSADVAIDEWLSGLGYGSKEALTQARQVLEQAGLTRAGKQRLSTEKLARATQALSEHFFLHCSNTPCVQTAKYSGRQPLLASSKAQCEACGGSDNQRAARDFLKAFGNRNLCVVGGSPAVFEELERLLGSQLQLRLVDGTQRRTMDHARSDLEWADLLLLWGAAELHHKVSTHYSTAPPPLRKKVVHVTRRGIAQLLSEAMTHLTNST